MTLDAVLTTISGLRIWVLAFRYCFLHCEVNTEN